MSAPVFQMDFIQDIKRPITIQHCGNLVFTGDNLSDTVSVSVLEDGEPYSISGTVAMNCIRADGATVTVTGSVSGNTASATLTQACVAIPGPLAVVIKVTSDTTTTTLLKAVYMVDVGVTGTAVDPGTIIPDVTTLINAIETAVGSIPADYSDLLATIAPNFVSGTYNKDQYVWNNGTLYRFTDDHSGSWTGTDVQSVVIGDELTNLKNAIEDTNILPVTYPNYVGKGYLSTSTIKWTSIGSNSYRYSVIPVQPNAKISVISNGSAQCNIAALKTFSTPVSGAAADISTASGWTSVLSIGTSSTIGTFDGTIPSDTHYLYVYLGNAQYNRLPTALLIGGYDYTKSLYANISNITDDIAIIPDLLLNSAGNGLPYATLNASDFKVGTLNDAGVYNPAITYRICTPDIHTVLSPTLIRPLEGYRVSFKLFTDGAYASTQSPGVEGLVLPANQQYKIIIRRASEDTSETVTVNALYNKALYFNKVQQIDSIAITGSNQYVKADYAMIPQAVFYPGVTDDYDTFDYDTNTSTVITAFDALVSANSAYITKSDLGTASDGESHIYQYDFNPTQRVGGTVFNAIPTLFIIAGQHGYEKASTFGLYYMLTHMISNDTDNPILNYLRNHIRIVCVPIANPYGFDNKSYKNYNGVNLNRNWDTTGWGTGTGEDTPSSKDYAGVQPFDQPETAAIRDAFNTIKSSVSMAIDFHTNGYESITAADYGEMNCILYEDMLSPLWCNAKQGVRYHIKNITAWFKKQFSITLADNKFCAKTITSRGHNGQAQIWFAENDKIAFTLETFAGFPEQSTYTANVIKASEEIISNFIISILNYFK